MTHSPHKADINVWGLLWVALAVVATLGGAWALPLAVRLVPWQTEVSLGRLLGANNLGAECDVSAEPGWQRVLELVARLYPQSRADTRAPIVVHLVDNPQVNAFASLGGQVFILTGLLEHVQSADELAGILAHELEHVSRRHLLRHLVDDAAYTTVLLALLGDGSAANKIAKTADYWSGLKFSRAQEAEADDGGKRRMQQAGIGLGGLIAFFERLDDGLQMPTWASDHPGLTQRVAALKQTAAYSEAPAMAWSTWQQVKALSHCAHKAPL